MGTQLPTHFLGAGSVLQVVRGEYLLNTSVSNGVSFTDVLPSAADGGALVSAAITPKYASSQLVVTYAVYWSSTAAVSAAAFVCRDGASGFTCAWGTIPAASYGFVLSGCGSVAAGSTASTSFQLRAGPSGGGIIYLNGYSGGRYFGGALKSFVQVMEVAA